MIDRGTAHYSPPWASPGIIGIAGSSGSGKTSLSLALVASLNLPWVVILSMVHFYSSLDDSSFLMTCAIGFFLQGLDNRTIAKSLPK